MTDYARTTFAEHLRLGILRLLAADGGGYAANESLLADGLERVGLTASRDRVRTELRWLEEQGLATVEDLGELLVGRATRRGVDVATGRATAPGVKRPSPRG